MIKEMSYLCSNTKLTFRKMYNQYFERLLRTGSPDNSLQTMMNFFKKKKKNNNINRRSLT